MTTIDANPDLTFKCLELCQLLASQGQGFSRKKDASLENLAVQSKMVRKKKLTPSQKRRNLLGKEKFLKKKLEAESEKAKTFRIARFSLQKLSG